MWELIDTILTYTIPMLSVLVFGMVVLNEKVKIDKVKLISLFVITCILQKIALTNFDETLKTIVMISNNVILYKLTFNISFLKALLLSFLYILLLFIPEIIVIVSMTKILGMSQTTFYEIYAGSLIANITICIILIIIVYTFRKILRKIINIKLEDNIKIIIYLILTFICILIFFYKAFMYIRLDFNFAISIFIIITFLTILFSLIKQTIENNKITKEYDRLLEFMTTYENEIEKQRILRHETKNEFLTIRAKICDNQKNKEIVSYIDEILKDKIKVNQEKYAKFGYLPPNGIKGLCYFKVQEAEEKNINVALNISKRIKDSTIYKLNVKQQREFGRILGVLLDNAIESCVISKEKKMGIEAYTNSNKEFKIIISNTFNNDIDKTKIGIEKFSTKGKNRGHGLLLVKHIINQNKIFNLETNIQDNIYTQTVIIKKDIEE